MLGHALGKFIGGPLVDPEKSESPPPGAAIRAARGAHGAREEGEGAPASPAVSTALEPLVAPDTPATMPNTAARPSLAP